MRNKKAENIILAVLVVSILGYCYYNFYLKGEIKKVSELSSKISGKVAAINNFNARKYSIDSELKAAKAKDNKYDEAIPDTFDKKEIIRYFYYFIKESGLTAKQISFSEPQMGDKSYKTVSVALKLEGEYSDIKRFISSIENAKRKFVISQASMGASEKGGYSMALTLEFYSLR